ncbi:hypothetical protein [Acidicapsa acidisoli]|nr:hypothetical protein [Acidicapsa acidisoli]
MVRNDMFRTAGANLEFEMQRVDEDERSSAGAIYNGQGLELR